MNDPIRTSPLGPPREHAEILTLMRFDEHEMLLPVGLASIEEDDLRQQRLVLRLAFLDRPFFLPLWDLLVLASIDPRVVSRYLRRRASRRRFEAGPAAGPP